MFEEMLFVDNEEKEFTKLRKLRGDYFLDQVYTILLSTNPEGKVNYSELLALVKYDKGLKNTLFSYISSFIDYLKAEIYRKYDVPRVRQYIGVSGTEKLIIDITPRKSAIEKSNLYFGLKLDFPVLVMILKKKKIFDEKFLDRLSKIVVLYNKVVHQNNVLFGDTLTHHELSNNILDIQSIIEELAYVLPGKTKDGLQKSINALNYDKKADKPLLSRFHLAHMNDGYFEED